MTSLGRRSCSRFAVRSAMPTCLENERGASHRDAATEVTDIELLWANQLAPALCRQREDGSRGDAGL